MNDIDKYILKKELKKLPVGYKSWKSKKSKGLKKTVVCSKIHNTEKYIPYKFYKPITKI